jgi:hypothetical protein
VWEEKDTIFIKNEKISFGFNLKNGLYYLANGKGEKIVNDGYFRLGGLQSKDNCEGRFFTQAIVSDELGKGKSITIKMSNKNYANILWRITLYNDKSYFVFDMGVENDEANPYQLISFYPVISNKVYQGRDLKKKLPYSGR